MEDTTKRYILVTRQARLPSGEDLRGRYMILSDARLPRSDKPNGPVNVRDPLTGSSYRMKRYMIEEADTGVAELWIERGGSLAFDPRKGILPAFADKRGRRSAAQEAVHRRDRQSLAESILQLRDEIGFSPSVRGWAYIAEEKFGLTKGQFDSFGSVMVDLRKDGLLPLNICSEDRARRWCGVETVDPSVSTYAHDVVQSLYKWIDDYRPVSFWEDKDVYIQLWTEKIDLVKLWENIAAQYSIPIANARGWSDLHCRANMMRRFRDWEAEGKRPVLLYCGDHDPAGLEISRCMLSNLEELQHVQGVDWNPKNLEIVRVGLNRDFIEEHRLPKVPNLQTKSGVCLSSPQHPDHGKPHVQSYLREHGVWKVEANALIVRPEAGRKLLLDAIHRYLSPDAPEEHRRKLSAWRPYVEARVRDALCSEFDLIKPEEIGATNDVEVSDGSGI